MAVRRGPKPSRLPKEAERLLTWSRHRRVPVELLEHFDPQVRALAEATDKAAVDFRQCLFAEYDGPEKPALEAEKDRQWAGLATMRRRYAEDRGLKWEHPDPWHPSRRTL